MLAWGNSSMLASVTRVRPGDGVNTGRTPAAPAVKAR